MSKKVFTWFVVDSILFAIVMFISSLLYNLFGTITYDIIRIILQTLTIITNVLITIVIIGFFLLYWWSDIKWSQCKVGFRRFKNKLKSR